MTVFFAIVTAFLVFAAGAAMNEKHELAMRALFLLGAGGFGCLTYASYLS